MFNNFTCKGCSHLVTKAGKKYCKETGELKDITLMLPIMCDDYEPNN